MRTLKLEITADQNTIGYKVKWSVENGSTGCGNTKKDITEARAKEMTDEALQAFFSRNQQGVTPHSCSSTISEQIKQVASAYNFGIKTDECLGMVMIMDVFGFDKESIKRAINDFWIKSSEG